MLVFLACSLFIREAWSFSTRSGSSSTWRLVSCRRLGASEDDAESLLAEVARLRSEISQAESELALEKEEEKVEVLVPEERGEPFSEERCMSVYTSDSSGMGSANAFEERSRFAAAMGFDDGYYFADGELTEAANVALSDIAAPFSGDDDEELFEASISRFRKLGVFEDVIDSEDFFATEEVGALVGLDIRRQWKPYGQPSFEENGIEKRSDEVGRALWRRWRNVLRDASDLQRKGELRECLRVLEKKSDVELIDAIMIARDKIEPIVAGSSSREEGDEEEESMSQRKKTKKLERALSEVVWRTKSDDSFEAQCVLDLEKVLLRDRDAWHLLRFTWRADRARACALGLALDTLINDDDPATSKAKDRLYRMRDSSPDLALLNKVVVGKSVLKAAAAKKKTHGDTAVDDDDDDVEALTEAATRLNVAAMTSQFIVEVTAGLSLFAFVCALVSLLPSSDSDANLAEQRFFDPLIFGSTDNRLDQLADFDMKYGTNFLSLPHPPTDKYPKDVTVTQSPFNFS